MKTNVCSCAFVELVRDTLYVCVVHIIKFIQNKTRDKLLHCRNFYTSFRVTLNFMLNLPRKLRNKHNTPNRKKAL